MEIKPAIRQMMHKCFTVLLGTIVGSNALAAAQAPTAQIVVAQEHIAPIVTSLRTASMPLSAPSFRLVAGHEQSPTRFNSLFTGVREHDDSLVSLPPTEELTNLILSLSSLPLVQLWGGRLQLDASQNMVHGQTVLFEPLGTGGVQGFRSSGQNYLGRPGSARLSLSFHFGRGARAGPPSQAWRSLLRIAGNALN